MRPSIINQYVLVAPGKTLLVHKNLRGVEASDEGKITMSLDDRATQVTVGWGL